LSFFSKASLCFQIFILHNSRCCVAAVKSCPVLHFSVVIFFWSFGIIDASTIKCWELSTAQPVLGGVKDVNAFEGSLCFQISIIFQIRVYVYTCILVTYIVYFRPILTHCGDILSVNLTNRPVQLTISQVRKKQMIIRLNVIESEGEITHLWNIEFETHWSLYSSRGRLHLIWHANKNSDLDDKLESQMFMAN
jgi:hypothetical protein